VPGRKDGWRQSAGRLSSLDSLSTGRGWATNLFSEDLPPLLVLPGVVALGVGSPLVAVGVLRAGLLPRYVGVALSVGAVAVLGFNEQDWRVILVVPFALAWVVLGAAARRGHSLELLQPVRAVVGGRRSRLRRRRHSESPRPLESGRGPLHG
jgi:hypothetical protein